jgi:hypothetical protein
MSKTLAMSSGLALTLALLLGALLFWFECPCDRLPGGPLKGAGVEEAVTDWSFANQAPLCQLQVDALIPWSVNLNCMADQGVLYISCARCQSKYWSSTVLKTPEGYIGIANKVYPVSIERVMDPLELDRAWRARALKVGRGNDMPRAGHWWSFRAASKTPR